MNGNSRLTPATLGSLLVLILLAMLNAQVLSAAPDNITASEIDCIETGTAAPKEATSVTAKGGNITAMNFSVETQTYYWQGFFGNVSGNIVLDDAAGNTFYDWAVSAPAGELYASRGSAIQWDNIICANSTHVASEEVLTGDGSDSVSNTFTSNNTQEFYVGTVRFPVDNCSYATKTYNSSGVKGTFEEILLYDDDSDLIYTTIIQNDAGGFNQQTVDFQILVAENGTDASSTPYYFFIELA